MSDSKTGKEKLGDGLVKAGGLLAALATFVGIFTKKD